MVPAGTNGEIYLFDGVSKLDLSIRTGELYLKEYNGNEIKVEVSGKDREKVRVGQHCRIRLLINLVPRSLLPLKHRLSSGRSPLHLLPLL